MEENNTNKTLTGTTSFTSTIENSTCTGGTLADISVQLVDDDTTSNSYTLTFKELRSFEGFENVPKEHAEGIINSLHQLSTICYRSILE